MIQTAHAGLFVDDECPIIRARQQKQRVGSGRNGQIPDLQRAIGCKVRCVIGTHAPHTAVRHQRTILREIGVLRAARPEQYVTAAKDLGAPVDLVRMVGEQGRLPVVNFAAGGLATPADAALMMQLGVDGVFVGSGIFKSEDPAPRARAIVEATTHFQDPDALAKVSRGLGEPMHGLDIKELGEEGLLQARGW